MKDNVIDDKHINAEGEVNPKISNKTSGIKNDIYNYEFKNLYLLREALTHSSFKRENDTYGDGNPAGDNERLEFLGDALLDLIIGDILFKNMPDEKEGNLSKTRANIVCEESLAKIAEKLDLGTKILLGRGEEKSGGRKKPSITADAVEALIGAIYLDSDFQCVYAWVQDVFQSTVESGVRGELKHDYKSFLQEKLQTKGAVDINYVTYREDGPPHDKVFFVKVFCNGKEIGQGFGKSKKTAEQDAARDAIGKGL